MPRRLYEFLEKKRYLGVNGIFKIGEIYLCRWLPIRRKNVTLRRKTIKNTADTLINAGYLLGYEFDKTKKLCFFRYANKEAKPFSPVIDIEPNSKEQKLASVYDAAHIIVDKQSNIQVAIKSSNTNKSQISRNEAEAAGSDNFSSRIM